MVIVIVCNLIAINVLILAGILYASEKSIEKYNNAKQQHIIKLLAGLKYRMETQLGRQRAEADIKWATKEAEELKDDQKAETGD